MSRTVWLLILVLATAAGPASAQSAPQAGTGVLAGTVTAQSGSIPLGGAQVVVFNGSTRVANLLSEGDGTFKVENLPPGDYRITALLDGFQPLSANAKVASGQTITLSLDLPLAETVVVTADSDTIVPASGTISGGDVVKKEELEQFAAGTGVQGALKLLASVIEVPGGVAIKGARPSQSGMQLGPGMFVDPATGLTQGTLPDDAIDSITVLPNPYAVEFGRFSAGVVVVSTRKGGDKWHTRVDNLDPSFRTKRGEPLNIEGFQSFYPRAEISGPLVKGKVFLQQALQYKYRANDVPSRPQDELRTSHRFSSFTRVDANLSPRHTLVAIGGFFPSTSKDATLGTFTPPDATVDIRGHVNTVGVTERAVLSDTLFLETTGEFNRYGAVVSPQGTDTMQLLPETTLGSFFNRQDRTTSTYQIVETLTGTRQTLGGLHQYKLGFDVVHSRFDGTSSSGPVLIKTTDGLLTRRFDYTEGGSQRIRSTDQAFFAQDRWQPGSRWYLEFGGRLDRDGVVDRWNMTPRIGSAVLLTPSGASVIRGGFGLFYERTPSAAGAFTQYEPAFETRFAADGATPLGPPVLFPHVTEDLQTSRSRTWDVAFDQRFNKHWSLHVGGVDRHGSHELVIDRVTEATGSALVLNSRGRSLYREIESSVHFTGGPGVDLDVSYVRAQSRADLNAFTTFYDNVVEPVFGVNAYAPARADVPHRLLARGRMMPRQTWLFTGVLDWRTGLPYSVVDAARDYVGLRNSERFPNYVRVDLGVEHRFKIGKLRPWIGVKIDNAMDAFLPSDVQANNSSPAFGNFYNTEYRRWRIQFRVDR